MPKFWFWQFFFVILSLVVLPCVVRADSIIYNSNSTYQGEHFQVFEANSIVDPVPPVNAVHPSADTDMTSDASFDADDADRETAFVISYGQSAYHLFIANLSGVSGTITGIKWKYNGYVYLSFFSSYFYVWNATSSSWFQCAATLTATSDTDVYCYNDSVGYSFNVGDMVNGTGYAHFLVFNYNGYSGGFTTIYTDYAEVEIAYTSSPPSSVNYSMNVSDEILVLEVKNLESSFFRLNYESFSWNDFPYKNARYVRTRYEPSGMGEFQSKNAALRVSSQDSVKGSDVLTRRFRALRDNYDLFTNSLNVVKGRFAFLMVYENADLQSASEVRSSFWRVTYSFAPVLDTVGFAKSLVRSVTDAFGVSDFFVQKFSFFRDWYEPFEFSDFFSGRYSCPLGWCEISVGGGGEVVLPPGGGGGFLGEEVEEPVFAEVLGHEVLVPQFLVRIWGNIKWLFSEENFIYILPFALIIVFITLGTLFNVWIMRIKEKRLKKLENLEVEFT